MYIRGLIPRNFTDLAEAVPIDRKALVTQNLYCSHTRSMAVDESFDQNLDPLRLWISQLWLLLDAFTNKRYVPPYRVLLNLCVYLTRLGRLPKLSKTCNLALCISYKLYVFFNTS